LKETGVTVTCLMPGPTETEFFDRADMMDTKVGQQKKDDPADVAKTGFDAMMRGDGDVVSGWKNKLQSAIASVTPSSVLAEQHRKMAEPRTGKSKARHTAVLDSVGPMAKILVVATAAGAAMKLLNRSQRIPPLSRDSSKRLSRFV
jgi:hypothetical protein